MRYTLFGESHGPAVGVLAEGFAPGIKVNEALLHEMMTRRQGGKTLTTQRRENDTVKILSGVYGGETTGDPLCLVIENADVRSEDYAALRHLPRPSHGDYVAYVKSHGGNDPRGGGHSSARLTAPLTALGAIALSALEAQGVGIAAHLFSCGGAKDTSFLGTFPTDDEIAALKQREFPTRKKAAELAMRETIEAAHAEGDSLGGQVECAVLHLPAGLGGREDNLQSRLAAELFAIPGVKAVSFGAGEGFAALRGSEANDPFCLENGQIRTVSNFSGGVNAGSSNGMPLVFTVTFRPTPSVAKEQQTVNLETMQEETIAIRGRHDPCIALRAVPVVEAAAALALYDLLPTGETELAGYRRQLDAADAALLRAFARRMELSKTIGEYKKEHGLPVLDAAREQSVIESRRRMVPEEWSEAAEKLMKTLLRISREEQKK